MITNNIFEFVSQDQKTLIFVVARTKEQAIKIANDKAEIEGNSYIFGESDLIDLDIPTPKESGPIEYIYRD